MGQPTLDAEAVMPHLAGEPSPRPAACPACGNPEVRDRGRLPALVHQAFGGRKTDVPLGAGRLYRCPRCDLRFRHPYVSQDVLTRLYEDLPDTVWATDGPRATWQALLPLLERYAANDTILDVGCFRGDFLACLPDRWRKLGIEPNRRAAEVAARHGTVIAPTLEQVPADVRGVGAITMLDVLEHLRAPMPTLHGLRRLLAPGGSLFLLTGAPDALTWRALGRHYWYSSLPEHVSFYSLRWFRWAADQLGLRVAHHVRLPSEPAGLGRWLYQGARASLFAGMRTLLEAGVPRRPLAALPFVGRAANWPTAPWWIAAADHLLIVLTS
jgi:SAM-dependent methyltransferase